MNDFKNMSERYRKQMLELYNRYPKDVPPQFDSNDITDTQDTNTMDNDNTSLQNNISMQDTTTTSEDIPQENVSEDTQPIEERYPTPMIPPFIYQADEDGITELPPVDTQSNQVGYLKVSTTSAEETIPLANVSVIVSKRFADHEEILYSLLTNDSGETEIVELPAPPKSLSESPSNDNSVKPYAEYNISTYLKGYYQVINSTVPIFSGITSIQKINMIPLPSHTTKRKIINIFGEEPNL